MKSKTTRHGLKRMTALLLALVLCMGMMPSAFAAQQDSYHDPAENWQEANNRTNELDANATVTHETFNCKVCKQQTSFIVFRTPEYTRDGQTAMSRNVKYSDGTFVDGSGKGSILDGVPGQDAYYTAYHWTKAVCETCGSINTNMAKTDYGYLKNVYWLYDCANNFFEELPETQTIEQADSEYHRVITTSGEYCGFCYGTFKEENSTLERHHMENAIRPELAHDRFVEMDTCADCGYAETSYTAAKAVIADYFGVVDGQPHTVTVSDLSEAGVTTAIRYGHSADACTLTSAPNYTEAGDYPVYYEITYTYHDTDMVEDGVAYVHLRDETTTEDGSCMRIFSSTVPPPGTSGVIKIGEPNGMRIPVWNWVRMMIPWSSLLPGAASRQFWRPFRESTRIRLSPTAGQTRTSGAMWERLYTKTEK